MVKHILMLCNCKEHKDESWYFSRSTLPSTRPGLGHNTTYRTWPALMTSAPTKRLASPWLKSPGNITCQGKLWKTMWLAEPAFKHFIENLELQMRSFPMSALMAISRALVAITKWIIAMITLKLFCKWFDYFLCNFLNFSNKISVDLVKLQYRLIIFNFIFVFLFLFSSPKKQCT